MKQISPQKYKSILDGIEINSIYLKSLKSTIDPGLITEGMSISIKDNASYVTTENGFIIENKYTLTSKNRDKKIVLKIESNYVLHFTSRLEVTDDFFDIYKNISLPLNVWPFFRELVNSITARMNIPPLTLPLLKQ